MKKTTAILQVLLLTLAITLSLPNKGHAQSDYQKQDAAFMVYNCGLGGVTSGLGALINKKKHERALPIFWRGFKYGALGGFLNYTSKRIDFLISGYTVDSQGNKHNEEALLWAWPTKLVHAAGSSIMENAAANKQNVFLDYNIPIGFVNLSVSLKNKLSIRPQLMPLSLLTFITICTNNVHLKSSQYVDQRNQFLLKESLYLGTPYFSVESTLNGFADRVSSGELSNSILFDSNQERAINCGKYRAHEYIHALQESEYHVFNKYFNKPYSLIVNPTNKTMRFISKYIYPDIPYFTLFYSIMPSARTSPSSYYKNIFEFEARHFGSNSYVKP